MYPSAPTEFELLHGEVGRALYRAVEPGMPTAYFLLAAEAPDPLPTQLGMSTSWKYPGAYILSDTEPTGSLEDLAARVGMSRPGKTSRALAWLPGSSQGGGGGTGPTPVVASIIWSDEGGGRLAAAARIPFGNLELLLPGANRVTVTAAGFGLAGQGVQFERRRRTAYPLPPEGEVQVPLNAPAAGRLVFGAEWDAYSLFGQFRDDLGAQVARGGELRFFQPDGEGGTEQLLYPIFAEVPSSGPENPLLLLDVELDPVAPLDGERTRMLFRAGGTPGLRCEGGLSPAGGAVGLAPLATSTAERAGFYFGARPGEPSSGGPSIYLAPLGPFELSFGDPGARLMCGLSALEFLAAETGDLLVFEPSRPAHAARGGGGEALLDESFTTSWVRFAPRPRETATEVSEPAYFGQPDASTNYGHGVLGADGGDAMTFPTAVASRVRGLARSSPGAFPMALYGGAAEPLEGKFPDPAAMTSFEGAVLAAERGALLRKAAPEGARAAAEAEAPPASPVFADASGVALKGGTTSTPQGFLVTLNDGDPAAAAAAGTWAKVDFARSKDETFSLAAAEEGGAVDPWLATGLVKDQLFLVLSDWDKAPGMSGRLTVGGFDFDLVPPVGTESSLTVLVFKYSTSRSLTELIEEEGAWEAKDHFVGEAEEVATTKAILVEALEVAKAAEGETGDPFAYFRGTIASQAGWTGVLAFNCLVPGNKVPADLQMLYAGMEGKLRAHHFGVELNRIERDGTSASISESSLFGVIHYSHVPPVEPDPPPPPAHDFEFTLRELNVAIRNSAVNDFHSRVLVRANRLFGRAVTLAPATQPANTITLSGQYQCHGEVGTVTFTAPSSGTFGFGAAPYVRVLAGMSVSAATLTPVSSTARKGQHGAETVIVAQVTLAGELMFNPAPFEELPELDLFSYGPEAGKPLPSEGGGIPLSGFGLTVECALYGEGEKTPTTVRPDLSAVLVADNHEALRPEGLVAKLPLTLKSFLAAEDGSEDGVGGEEAKKGVLDTAKLGALPVNVVPLSGPGGRVTSQPTYALQFSLPMGSLGGLADAHASLEATLILGWGPSTFSTDDDGIGVFVALPFVSAGAFGFELQGLLKTTFGDANLARVTPSGGEPTYVVLFNNIALSLLGLRFPPRVITDFILFAGPETKGRGNLGWSLAATMPASGPAALASGAEVTSR